MLSEKMKSQLKDDVSVAFGKATFGNLANGFRLTNALGQVNAVYWSSIHEGNDVEIAISPAAVTEVYGITPTMVRTWLESEVASSGRNCNVHKHESDWPIIGFSIDEVPGFLARYKRLRLGGLSKSEWSALELNGAPLPFLSLAPGATLEDEIDYVEVFKSALTELRPKITDGQMKMLIGHYAAPDKTISVKKLATLAGYEGARSGSLHYGKLARAISEVSGISPPTVDQMSVLAEWTTSPDENGHGQWIMYDEFAKALEELGWVDADQVADLDPPDVDGEIFANEGAVSWVMHLRRERNRAIVEEKKNQIFNEKQTLACEVCEFDFEKIYGEHGKDYCEVHHKVPLASAGKGTKTQLHDLAIVCSNCHRMLHRRSEMLAIEELRAIVKGRLTD